MRTPLFLQKCLLLAAIGSSVLLLSAWQVQPSNNTTLTQLDTVPAKPKKTIDIDEALNETTIILPDLQALQKDINKSLQSIDFGKLKADVNASIASIDWDKMKKELDKIKEIDLPKIQMDLQNLQPQLDKAKESLEKATKDLQAFQTFIDDLAKDGLIDKSKPYTIETRNGQLLINNKVQPEAVTNKYRTFLEAHKNTSFHNGNNRNSVQ